MSLPEERGCFPPVYQRLKAQRKNTPCRDGAEGINRGRPPLRGPGGLLPTAARPGSRPPGRGRAGAAAARGSLPPPLPFSAGARTARAAEVSLLPDLNAEPQTSRCQANGQRQLAAGVSPHGRGTWAGRCCRLPPARVCPPAPPGPARRSAAPPSMGRRNL